MLAATVHASILFISPICWLAHRTYSFRFYLIIQFASLFLFFTHGLDSLPSQLMARTTYTYYLDSVSMGSTLNTGIKYLTIRMESLFVLLYYPKLLKEYPRYVVPFNMFFFSVVFGDLFANIFILHHMEYYFDGSFFIVIPLFLSSVFKRGNSYRIAQSFVLYVLITV